MISIVVCSVKEERFNKFSQSVAETIGVPFEIIRVDNSKNEYSLCGAYNKGKAMCKYDIICFSHEDVYFETKDWGKILMQILGDKQIGMVGIFGLCYFSLFPYGWIDFDEAEGQMIVGAIAGNPVKRHVRFPSDSIAEVAGVDGIFMVTRKEIIDKLNFADDVLKGFHGYDVDINLQIRKNYKIVVSRDIMLYHESGGSFNASYFESMKAIEKKWRKTFPVYISRYSKKEIHDLNIKSLDMYYEKVIRKNGSFKNHLSAMGFAIRQKVLFRWLRKNLPGQLIIKHLHRKWA